MQFEPSESFTSILLVCSTLLAYTAFGSLVWFGIRRNWRAVGRLLGLTALTLLAVVIGFLLVLADCQGLHGGCSGHEFGIVGLMGFLLWFGSVPTYLAVLILVWRRR